MDESMSEPLSEERLSEIEERASRTPSPPWQHSCRSHGVVGPRQAHGITDQDGHPVALVSMHPSNTEEEIVDFLAHARTDIPDLVAEVRRLRAEVGTRIPLGYRKMLDVQEPLPARVIEEIRSALTEPTERSQKDAESTHE